MTTIAQFVTLIEAQIAQERLKAEGIESQLLDENIIQANPLYSNAIGGIKLQVPEHDAKIALRILETPVDLAEVEAEQAWEGSPHPAPQLVRRTPHTCPKCGSKEIRTRKLHESVSRPFYLLSFLLFGAPFTWISRGWICESCDHHWK